MPYAADDMADLMAYDDLCAQIYARRMPPGTRELALTFAWTLLRDPERTDGTSSSRAYRLLGAERFRKLVSEDVPLYRRPQACSGPCDGPRFRPYRPRTAASRYVQAASWDDNGPTSLLPAEPEQRDDSRCGTRVSNWSNRVDEYDMVTGQVSRVYWYCSRHQAEADRVRRQLAERGTPPPAIPNQGGVLPCLYEPEAVEKLYRWAVHRWEPPYHGICADDWPAPGYEVVPKRPRLALIVGGLEAEA